MKFAPFGLTSVNSSWKPFCLRSIGRTSFSKRLLSSVSLPLLIWKWTLRANLMVLLPEPLNGGDLHRRVRNGGTVSSRYRNRLGPLKRSSHYHTSRHVVAHATLLFELSSNDCWPLN